MDRSRGGAFHVETSSVSPHLPGEQGAQDSEGQLRDASWRPASSPAPTMVDVETESQRGAVSDPRPHSVLLPTERVALCPPVSDLL